MARYVSEGAGVTLVTCTAGEMGEILVPELAHLAADQEDKLGEHRRGEIADAMKVLGVTDHRWLGGFQTYRDSGMKWHEDGYAVAADDIHDNAFWHADLTEAADHLVRVIREVQPQVLVTYDQFGGYGHPDHIQAHRVAMYAAQLAAVPSYSRELGEPWDIAKIYWGAMSESRMRESLRALRAAGDTTTFEGMDPDGKLPPFVTSDENLSAAIDGSSHLEQKMDAMRAYPTQITLDGPFFCSTEFARRRLAAGLPGAILCIGATYAWTGGPGASPSAAAKAGVANLVQSLSVEWAPDGIRINGLMPGVFPHEDQPAVLKNLPGRDTQAQRIPALRVGELHELAWAATFLCSPFASYITGHNLVIDGANWLRRGLRFPEFEPVRDWARSKK